MSQIFLSPFAMPELDRVVEQLCAPSSLEGVFHRPLHDAPMPSLDVLGEILSRLKIALFPGYFGMSNVRMESMRYHLSANLDSIFRKLAEQIRCGACFACAEYAQECLECERISREKALEFIERLPHIRRLLATDARAAYQGDPAATSAGETIFCYPSILTMIHYRIAHELYLLEVPIIPRILCEMATPLPASTSIPARPSGRRSSSITAPAWSLGKRASSAGDAVCIRGLRSARCPSPRGPTGCSSRASPAIRSWRTT